MNEITKNYENHQSIIKIKENIKDVTSQYERYNPYYKISKDQESYWPDGITIRVIQTAANVINSYFADIINKDLKDSKFSENAKTALVKPTYKDQQLQTS